jgi:hypothetical protein
MNGYWLAAGIMAALTTGIHVIAGHFNPILPMLRAPFEEAAKRTMHAVWHAITVALALSALALIAAGLDPARYGAGGLLPWFVAIHYVGYTVAFLVVALAARVPLIAMPQPALFVPVVVTVWLGS